MEYVILDLEWNQCPYGKDRSKKNLPFEIIEIGAIKLDENRQEISEFHRVIKPKEYKKLHYQTQKVIHLTDKDLSKGIGFEKAMDALFNWCSPESIFCTWGISDLTELQRNMDYFKVANVFPKPLYYYDVQELMAIDSDEPDKRMTLESAIEYLKIKKERPFHGALEDAYYTSKVFQRLNWKKVEGYISFNCYRPPQSKDEEISITYPDSSKYVSREFATKERAMKDRSIAAMQCYKCGKMLRPKIKWFAVQQKMYEGVYRCPRHGLMLCKIKFRNTANGNYFAIKSIESSDRATYKTVIDKKEQIKIKRKQRNIIVKRKKANVNQI